MPDQTALNLYAKRKYLKRKFNEQRKIKKDTVVKHFCEAIKFYFPFWLHVYNIKQWNRDRMHNELKITMFDDLYEIADNLREENPCFVTMNNPDGNVREVRKKQKKQYREEKKLHKQEKRD